MAQKRNLKYEFCQLLFALQHKYKIPLRLKYRKNKFALQQSIIGTQKLWKLKRNQHNICIPVLSNIFHSSTFTK